MENKVYYVSQKEMFEHREVLQKDDFLVSVKRPFDAYDGTVFAECLGTCIGFSFAKMFPEGSSQMV